MAFDEAKYAPIKDRLGKVDDGTLAAEIGVNRGTLGAYRRSLGIAKYDGYLWAQGRKPRDLVRAEGGEVAPAPTKSRAKRKVAKPTKKAPAGRTSKLEAFRERIGVETDAAVALVAGVSSEAVRAFRKKNGIPRSGAKGGRPAASRTVGNVTPLRAVPRENNEPAAVEGASKQWICHVLIQATTIEEAITVLRQGGGDLDGVGQFHDLPPSMLMGV